MWSWLSCDRYTNIDFRKLYKRIVILGIFKKDKPLDNVLLKKLALDAIEDAICDHLEHGKNGVVVAVEIAINQAIHHGASDIHFESWGDCLALRFRIDGILHDVAHIPKDYQTNLMARLKILAGMVPYKKDVPQDGRIDAEATGCGMALRASTFPTVHGEQIVLRVSDSGRNIFTLDMLGFHGSIARSLRNIISKPQGTLLLTGPSSNGKTTTIYALLHERIGNEKHPSKLPAPHVVTIEDPIEYKMDRISQTEINTAAGFTYKTALRSVLRQDPDVIVVGEIRDAETAHAAIQAGLTGQLVISTIHSGTAAGVFTRLLDMGMEPFLVASSVTGVLSQRLVRRCCQKCLTAYEPSQVLLRRFGFDPATKFKRGNGCEECEGLGYVGRTAIGEMLTMKDELAELILARSRTRVLHRAAVRNRMMPIDSHGIKKVKRYKTTVEELDRVLPPPEEK